jgi:rhodanese-related sulfurtransferase
MIRWCSRLSLQQRLALLTLLLGIIAAVAGNPYRGNRVSLDTQELALLVQNEQDHVTPRALADWIIKGKSDYRLLDLRSPKEFEDYHIPSAENVTLSGLNDFPILRNEKIVLYSEGGIHAAQAWFLLAAKGYKHAYILLGGLDAWNDEILFPTLTENATPTQKADFEKVKAVSAYFGGNPQTGGAPEQVSAKKALPKLSAPTGSAAPATAGGKKKKEGC